MATLAISGGSVREGAAGQTTTLTFTLTRDGDLSAPLELPWHLWPNLDDFVYAEPMRFQGLLSAPGDADFADGVWPSGTVGFAAGEAVATVSLAMAGDDAPEPDERFILHAGDASGQGTLLSDETWFRVRGDTLMPEAAAGGIWQVFSVARLGRSDTAVTVDFTTLGIGAAPVDAADFIGGVLPGGTLTFAPGETRQPLPVVLRPDAMAERDETLRILLSNPQGGAVLAPAPWLDVVAQNDDLPADDPAEGPDTAATIAPGATVQGAVDVRRDHDWFAAALTPGQAWRIRLRGQGLATPAATLRDAGGVALAETAPLGPEPLDRVLVVTPQGAGPWFIDVGSEDRWAWWNTGGYELSLDAVTPLAVVADAPGRAEGAAGESAGFTFTISRSQLLDTALELPWRVEGDGPRPVEGADFAGGVLPAGTVAFAPGQAQAVVTVATLGNDLPQGPRGLRLLAGTEADAIVAPASAAVALLEDDAPPPDGVLVSGGGAGVVPAWFDGPVPGVARQWVATTAENLTVAAQGPGWFLHTGDGDDAIVAASGTNVLDGGGGSNFLVGGDGVDHFFVDLRAATGPSWTTIANAAPGDTVTLWGAALDPHWLERVRVDGAPGWQGETITLTAPGGQPAVVTLAGVGVWGGHSDALQNLPAPLGPAVLLTIC